MIPYSTETLVLRELKKTQLTFDDIINKFHIMNGEKKELLNLLKINNFKQCFACKTFVKITNCKTMVRGVICMRCVEGNN